MTGAGKASISTGRRARRWRGLGAAVAGVSLLLAGCGTAPELAPATARQLQEKVLVVGEAVAAGRLDEADGAASQVREQLEAAVDGGDVSASRYRVIDEALDGVTAEIAAAQEAVAAAEQAAADQAAAEQAAAEQAAAEQAAADGAEADRKNGRGNNKDDDD